MEEKIQKSEALTVFTSEDMLAFANGMRESVSREITQADLELYRKGTMKRKRPKYNPITKQTKYPFDIRTEVKEHKSC